MPFNKHQKTSYKKYKMWLKQWRKQDNSKTVKQ